MLPRVRPCSGAANSTASSAQKADAGATPGEQKGTTAGEGGSSRSGAEGAETAPTEADASATPAEQQGKTAGEGGSSGSSSAAGEETKTKKEEPTKSPLELISEELTAAEKIRDARKTSLLLALADFENNKKKSQAERSRRSRTAMVKGATVMVDLFSEFDTLAGHQKDKQQSASCTSLQEGVEMTVDIYRSTMEKFDIEVVVPEVGAAFEAVRHDNVGTVDIEGVPSGKIAELVKPGWAFEPSSPNGTVIRKAQVKVASTKVE